MANDTCGFDLGERWPIVAIFFGLGYGVVITSRFVAKTFDMRCMLSWLADA
jgi:hypothetical protein